MLVQRDIAGLYKGVSRQEATNRIEGQVEESINMMHSIEKGVTRRNPTQLLNTLGATDVDSFIHSYSRGDGIEEYIIVIQDSGINVYDTDGNPKEVNYIEGSDAYFGTNGLAPYRAFRALTVGDTTFIVNKSKVVNMSSLVDGTPDEHLNNPFYWAKRSFDNGGGEGYTYRLDGSIVNATSTTTAINDLATSLGSDYDPKGSVLVKKTKPSTFVWSDSYGNQASEGFWGTALKIEDLPRSMGGAEDTYNFLIQITGDPDNEFTKFWVKYEDSHWKETRAPNLQNTIDKTTMPIKLVSQADGTFTVEYIDYTPRMFGDEDTAPIPSFIDDYIKDIFFFKNRLCFISNENVIMSETADYFNFFPTTVTSVLDSDPIDVAVDANSVALLKNAVPFNDSVMLMSDGAQFSMKAEKVLSPTDVSISNTTSYNAVGQVRPIPLGSSLFFLSESTIGSSLREYYVDAGGTSNIAVDISSHVAGYLPKNVINMIGNTNQDIIMLLSKEDRSSIYIYKFYNDNEERLQTAWFKWTFGGNIINISILEDYMYIIIDRNGTINLEKIDYSNKTVEVYLDNESIPYDSYIELSEVVLRDAEGKIIQSSRAPLMYRTLKLTTKEGSTYRILIDNKIRSRVAEKFAVSDNKILVQGKSTDIKLIIKSTDDKPLEFHTYAMEMNYNLRARLI